MVGGSATRGGGGGGVDVEGRVITRGTEGVERWGWEGRGRGGGVECCTVVLHAVSKHICCYGILVNTMLKSKVDEGF